MEKWYPIATSELGKLPKLGVKPEEMRHIKAYAGMFRKPCKGEWFLSGAIPEAYRASSDMSQAYYVAILCVTEEVSFRRALRIIA